MELAIIFVAWLVLSMVLMSIVSALWTWASR